jgi:hypothetical protein
MSVKVANSRFIHSSIEIWAKLHLARNISDFHQLGSCLVLESEKAQALRQAERLQELSFILSQIPIQEYQLIGLFYQCWSKTSPNPQKLLENVIEKSRTYKAKAMIALGTLEVNSGDDRSGLKLYIEAMRHSHNPSIMLHAARSIAVVKGMDGLHYQAIKDLDRISPLVRYSSPIARYQYLNSLAVELGSLGKIEEAGNVCQVVLASPYAFAYPEWRETGAEIARRGYKSRSAVSVTQTIPGNLLYLPEPGPVRDMPTKSGRARIFSYENWKKKMGKEPNGDENDKAQLTDRQMVMKIMEYATDDDLPDEALSQMLEAVKKISHSFKSKKGGDKD